MFAGQLYKNLGDIQTKVVQILIENLKQLRTFDSCLGIKQYEELINLISFLVTKEKKNLIENKNKQKYQSTFRNAY